MYPLLMYSSLILFFSTILIVIISYLFSQRVIQQVKTNGKNRYILNIKDEKSLNEEKKALNIVWFFNLAGGICFILAVLVLSVYTIINLNEVQIMSGNNKESQIPQEEKRGAPVPSSSQYDKPAKDDQNSDSSKKSDD